MLDAPLPCLNFTKKAKMDLYNKYLKHLRTFFIFETTSKSPQPTPVSQRQNMSKFYFARIPQNNLIFDFFRLKQKINHNTEAPPSKQKTSSTQLPNYKSCFNYTKRYFFEGSRFLVVSGLIKKIFSVLNKIYQRYLSSYLVFLNIFADPEEFILIIGFQLNSSFHCLF